ncbi:MAG: UDP-3-O-(3-hydroxymyristoyl)glucosamine N-acyltransferase [Deinococcota bacterium]|nr:UDP-3-O-(3-hydroxymyristoyl)glucosamine N-acyltransferase [Deinococcota bacterium]
MRLSEIAERLGGRLEGEDGEARGLAGPRQPSEACIVVLERSAALDGLERSAALVVAEDLELPGPPASLIRVSDPRLALARLSALFDSRPRTPAGIHGSASVHPSARLGEDVAVGAQAVLEEGVVVGNGAEIGAGCFLGAGVVVGAATRLHAGVTICDGVRLGERVLVHSGAVVGADGFGFVRGPEGAVKIHHLGGVEIGDDVEIGANSCIDRGTLGSTRIGPRTKIDNLVQIAHNVQIGADCLIAGHSGVAGSSVLEDGVVLGGGVSVTDHVRIGRSARLAGRSGVTKSVPPGETWAGFPAQPQRKWVRQLYLLGRLGEIWDMLKEEWRTKS